MLKILKNKFIQQKYIQKKKKTILNETPIEIRNTDRN